jgi:Flp pilus assembly protein TadD
MLTGRYDRAADVYRDAVRISPDDVTLQCQLGLALALADKNVEAVTVLAPVARKEKDLPGYVLVALGRAHLGAGQATEAKAALRRAAATSPNSLSAWSWLARAALTGNDLVTAREAAARATEVGAGAPEPFILLGYVCLRQGHKAAAVRALETALQKQPDDSLTLYLLDQARRAGETPVKTRNPGEGVVITPAAHQAPTIVEPPPTDDGPDPDEIVRRANNALRSNHRGEVPSP